MAHNFNILREYALKEPKSFPSSVLFSHSANSLAIYDTYPKSIFHFLLLPRVKPPLDTGVLTNLKSLLKGDKAQARQVITALNEDAIALRKDIEGEMIKRYGFKWDIWMGFHAAPSMPHLHLHVLSSDLRSERMKNKKHYNSFHPSVGFFLDISKVLSWFEAEDSYFSTVSPLAFEAADIDESCQMARLDPKPYEALLKEDLTCFQCGSSMKNIPTLKAHLEEEWDKLSVREKAKLERKKKFEERHAKKRGALNGALENTEPKKQKLETSASDDA